MQEDIKAALNVLLKGGIILYPTDTIWGIGCDATNETAVSKIYNIKKRSDSKSLIVLIDQSDRLSSYIGQVPEIAWQLLKIANKPLTIIYPGAKNLAKNAINLDGTIGIRISTDPFCKNLISQFKKPIISTSANISGKPYPANFSEIDPVILSKVDYIVKWKQNDKTKHSPSSIIKLGIKGEVEIIRK